MNSAARADRSIASHRLVASLASIASLAIGGGAALLGCSGGGGGASSFTPSTGGARGDDAGASSGDDGDRTGSFGDAGSLGSVDAAAPSQAAEVYGHSADALYRLDPDTKAVTVVGQFAGCDLVIDIALDKDSNLYGTTSSALWRIDRKTAACTKIATGSYPNSLSFVPAGTLDPNAEALVGYEGDAYVRIDPSTGSKSTVGTIGGGMTSSGDIVSVKGGGTYLTVKSSTCDDCLVEVNPATGAVVKNWGPVGHANVFGLAFWAGKVYGFDDEGELFEVGFTGGALSTSSIAIPGAPAGLQFWGAGSTTSAPVAPR